MYRIIDGDRYNPRQIAEKLNHIGALVTLQDLERAINDVMAERSKIVEKILKTGKTGPVTKLIGEVMVKLNRRGDPQTIRELIDMKLERLGLGINETL